MTTAIAHRGPDDEGVFVEGPIGLGNRRLAIIDPTPAGHQPMELPEVGLTLTFNGEIYNFAELRKELEMAGHSFRSHTDTEVVLRAYAEWGSSSVERFNGMFGMAIWDARRQELFLARDRYGVKPLYICELGDTLLFGSEIKTFLEHPRFRVGVSGAHLLEYFTFQNIFTDGTLFEGVRLLRPGHRVLARAGHPGLDIERWWDWNFTEPDGAGDP